MQRKLPISRPPCGQGARACAAALVPLLLLSLSPHAGATAKPTDMADLSIEELSNIVITSVSKKPERLADAAASVFVITADDIRRSGATSVAEALRLAPNLQVAQSNGSSYAITARGLNGSNNSGPNKLLVMIDGRSVYSPLFSGVFWDVQDVVLEDIERIEVISGPGGTMWGVNAVNGVINITTRMAQHTQGKLLSLAAGTHGADAAFRYGGGTAERSWRVFGKSLDRRHTDSADGAAVRDAWHKSQIGFRADWSGASDRFSLNGNAYRGREDQPEPGAISVTGTSLVLGPVDIAGANLTGSWSHALDGGAGLALQAYADYTKRVVRPTYAESLHIVDLQFQHTLRALGSHSIVWGANYRHARDHVRNGEVVAFLPARVNQSWASLFAQDEVKLGEDWRATVGARIERNDYTGNEFLPTMRLAWKAAPNHAIWAGASRTLRAPSRLDADTYIPASPPHVLRGGPQVRSELANVFELGYRGQPSPALSLSATLFHNDYKHLRTLVLDESGTFLTFGNQMQGKASGIEMWGNLQLTPRWRMSAGLFGLHQRFTLQPGAFDAAAPGAARKDPSHTAQLRSNYSFSDAVEWDVALRKVGKLANPDVPGYTALDMRLGWQLGRKLTLALSGQNLTGSHGEYGPVATRTEVPRSVALSLVWRE
jgi:iron complex outermembrane receptor protein